ncbi:NAD(P)H-dependent oxidoreductase [Pseudonocardia kujensis]|uniref:NADPH-dependent FMN reductase n=1 Tax=Pseudonocardia kujensis TaxID=1128675 RepID=UPI001E349E1D|nr:NADPH-dependent FMN reductase [Pseudonocardia kujensis]MCE0767737.1 NAD(P)H-dependent oxidoreductase [Pseudonocardia kujensis]
MSTGRPFILGIGGTGRAGSSSERALAYALRAAEEAGARVRLITAGELDFPMYSTERRERTAAESSFLRDVERADGVIISSPGYHGGVSGLLKNALDYLEDLRTSSRVYLDGTAVGCIVCAHGWQAAMTTLTSLRSIVHALRGWPTPLGVPINSALPVFDETGAVSDQAVAEQLRVLGGQVVDFARMREALIEATGEPIQRSA